MTLYAETWGRGLANIGQRDLHPPMGYPPPTAQGQAPTPTNTNEKNKKNIGVHGAGFGFLWLGYPHPLRTAAVVLYNPPLRQYDSRQGAIENHPFLHLFG